MYSVTSEFRQHLKDCDFKTLIKLTIAPTGGSSITITQDDVVPGTCKITGGTTESGIFDFGGVVIPKFEATIIRNDLEDIDFKGAKLSVSYGIRYTTTYGSKLDSYCPKGTFYLDEAEVSENSIKLTGNGPVSKLDAIFDPTEFNALSDPTLGDLIYYVLKSANISMYRSAYQIDGYDTDITKIRDANFITGDERTCRELIRNIGQITGYYADAGRYGVFDFSTYNKAVFDDLDTDDTDSIDESLYWVFRPNNLISFTPWRNELSIDGIRLYYKSSSPGERMTYQAGADGSDAYVLYHTNDNPLVTIKSQSAETGLYYSAWTNRIEGLSFTPMTLTAPSNPALEIGDPFVVIDKDNNIYKAYVTNMTMTFGGLMEITCDAEKPERHKEKMVAAASTT